MQTCNETTHFACKTASSASIERIFSNLGMLQTKLLNRLGHATTAQLVLCYRSLRGSTELDW